MWSAVSNGIGMVVCLSQHDFPKNRPVISATEQIAMKILLHQLPSSLNQECQNHTDFHCL